MWRYPEGGSQGAQRGTRPWDTFISELTGFIQSAAAYYSHHFSPLRLLLWPRVPAPPQAPVWAEMMGFDDLGKGIALFLWCCCCVLFVEVFFYEIMTFFSELCQA